MGRLALCALCALTLIVPASARAADTRAGVAVKDATWHVGASRRPVHRRHRPGGRASRRRPAPAHDQEAHLRRRRRCARSTRALRGRGRPGRPRRDRRQRPLPAAGLPDRRVASLLARARPRLAGGQRSTGITDENLAITASHNHKTPFYSTPGWGTAIFQDVIDLRFYDYMARQMAERGHRRQRDAGARCAWAARRARSTRSSRTPTARRSATTARPPGQPYNHTTRQLSVVRFDDISDPRKPQAARQLGRRSACTRSTRSGATTSSTATSRTPPRAWSTASSGRRRVFTQRETGTSGPHKDTRVHPPETRREFQDNGFAQLDRAARLLADAHRGHAERHRARARRSARAPTSRASSDFDVAVGLAALRAAGHAPVPGRLELQHGVALPRRPARCRSSACPTAQTTDDYGTQPGSSRRDHARSRRRCTTSSRRPASRSPSPTRATALTAVEETAAVHLMAIKLGGIGVDGLPVRAVHRHGAEHREPPRHGRGQPLGRASTGPTQKTPAGRDWCVPGDGAAPGRARTRATRRTDLAPISDLRLPPLPRADQQRRQGLGDRPGDAGLARPSPPTRRRSRATSPTRSSPSTATTSCSSVGMGNDYWGYMPEYREYALARPLPQGAQRPRPARRRLPRDAPVAGMAASLNGGAAGRRSSPLDTGDRSPSRRRAQARRRRARRARAAPTRAAYERDAARRRRRRPAIVAQPADITRFAAAHLSFDRRLELHRPARRARRAPRRRAAGTPYGDMHGDVQLMVDFPTADELLA